MISVVYKINVVPVDKVHVTQWRTYLSLISLTIFANSTAKLCNNPARRNILLALRCLNKLICSGGHNLLVLARGLGQYIQLGTSIDDAIGEAYDKSARWLGLDMRKGGGPALEELALEGDPNAVKFKVSLLIFFFFFKIKMYMLLSVFYFDYAT